MRAFLEGEGFDLFSWFCYSSVDKIGHVINKNQLLLYIHKTDKKRFVTFLNLSFSSHDLMDLNPTQFKLPFAWNADFGHLAQKKRSNRFGLALFLSLHEAATRFLSISNCHPPSKAYQNLSLISSTEILPTFNGRLEISSLKRQITLRLS